MTFSQLVAKQKYYIRMADSEMKRNPESWMVDFATKLKWDYCNGLELPRYRAISSPMLACEK